MQEQPTIILARHAQSLANLLEGNPKDPYHERLERSVTDSDITELGIKQSIELGEKLKDYNIKIVYTSPLRRAIETSLTAFQNHPSKPKIVCLPILRESLYSACDMPSDIEKTMKDPSFKDVDFSLLDSYPDKRLYWLEDSFELEVKEIIKAEIERREIKDDYEKILDLTYELLEKAIRGGEVNFNGLETNDALFERALKVREVLKEKALKLNKGEKAVVMSHFLLLKGVTAQGIKDKNIYGHTRFKNCEFLEVTL